VLGTARVRARGLVVVVPVEDASYVAEYAGVEPPTEMVDVVKPLVAVRVKPDNVMVVVAPRLQAALPESTVSVIVPDDTADDVTSAPPINIAYGVPEKGRPVICKVPPGAMVLAAPAELTPMVTVRQAVLVWQVPSTVTLVT